MDEKELKELFNNENVKKENHKLLELYEKNWDIVLKVREAATNNEELVFHSSCIPPNYKEMQHKILVVGKKTNGWEFEEKAKESMLLTLKFLYSTQHNDKLSFTFPYKFCKSINNYNYQNIIKKTYFAWISLNKFAYGKDDKTELNEEAQYIVDNKFNILEKEIEIINPDIVLFLTGDYDRYIEKQLDGVKFHELENSECYIARVEHKVLDKRISFRTYQPDYFRFLKKGMYDKCIQELVKECGL